MLSLSNGPLFRHRRTTTKVTTITGYSLLQRVPFALMLGGLVGRLSLRTRVML